MRQLKLLLGAIVAIGAVAVDALNWWSVLGPTLSTLRSKGSFGTFVAGALGSHLVMLCLAIAAVLFVVRAYYEGEKGSPPTGQPPMHVEIKPQITVNPQIAAVMNYQQGPETPAFEERTTAVPHLTFIQAKEVTLDTQFATWAEFAQGVRGLVATFKNEPGGIGEQRENIQNVASHLIYRNAKKEGTGELHISFGTWLNKYTHYATFVPGQTQSLIVAVQRADKMVALDNPKTSSPLQRAMRSNRTIYPPVEKEISCRSGEVEIVLVDGSNVTVFRGRFSFDFTQGEGMSLTERG